MLLLHARIKGCCAPLLSYIRDKWVKKWLKKDNTSDYWGKSGLAWLNYTHTHTQGGFVLPLPPSHSRRCWSSCHACHWLPGTGHRWTSHTLRSFLEYRCRSLCSTSWCMSHQPLLCCCRDANKNVHLMSGWLWTAAAKMLVSVYDRTMRERPPN